MKALWLFLFLCAATESRAASDDFGIIGNLQGTPVRARQIHETAGRHMAYSLELTWKRGSGQKTRTQAFFKSNYDWIDWKTSFRVHPTYIEISIRGSQVDDSNPDDPGQKTFARKICAKPRSDFSRFDEFDCPRLRRRQAP